MKRLRQAPRALPAQQTGAQKDRASPREASRHEPRRTVSQSRPDTDSSQGARESVSSSQSKRCLITNLPRAINPFELLMVYCAPRQWSRSDGTPLSQREIGESSAIGNARSVCRTDSAIARAYATRPDASQRSRLFDRSSGRRLVRATHESRLCRLRPGSCVGFATRCHVRTQRAERDHYRKRRPLCTR